MNIYYAKTVLYGYSCIEKLCEQIDELAYKKALSSISDISPAFSQCEKIVDLTNQKILLINLKLTCDKILKIFNEYDYNCLDYKYFHIKNREYFKNFDFSSRKYFRRQNKIAKIFSDKLEKNGFTDKVFEKDYLEIKFIKELLKRVIEHEKNCYKNKPKKNKTIKTETDFNKQKISA